MLTIFLWLTDKVTGVNANVVALIPFAVFAVTGIFTKEDLKDKFQEAREAMIKINGLCKSYNFPLIYPDYYIDEKEIYKISCQYGKDVDNSQDIWDEEDMI